MKALAISLLVVVGMVVAHLAIELLARLIPLEPDTHEAGMRHRMGILIGSLGGQWIARKITARLREHRKR
jgi:hypothetical protein